MLREPAVAPAPSRGSQAVTETYRDRSGKKVQGPPRRRAPPCFCLAIRSKCRLATSGLKQVGGKITILLCHFALLRPVAGSIAHFVAFFHLTWRPLAALRREDTANSRSPVRDPFGVSGGAFARSEVFPRRKTPSLLFH